MPSFKETYEAIKNDWSKGEKNFNIECEMLSEGMQVLDYLCLQVLVLSRILQ